jgi:signal transduction histidine kinase
VICYDVQQDPRFDNSFPRNAGFRSVVAIPFVVQDRVVAVAYGLTFEKNITITEEQVDLAWGLADAAALAIDNARLFEESRKRLRETQCLQRLTAALLREFNLETILELVCHEAQNLINALAAAGLLREEKSDTLYVGHSSGKASILKVLLDDSELNRQALEESKPVMSGDEERRIRLSKGLPLPIMLLAVPLILKDKTIGILKVASKPGGFGQEDIRMLSRVADQTVLAIESANLYRQVKEFAICEERDRLAREMHDNMAHVLSTINWRASTIDRLISEGQINDARIGLRELKSLAKKGYADTRQTIYALRSSSQLEEEFVPTLRSYLDEFRDNSSIDVVLVVDEKKLPHFSLQVRLQVIRIIQEALSNVSQHSGAQTATVRIHKDISHLQITIEDNGWGFESDKTANNNWYHFGLTIMRERASSIGGELQIWSKLDQGTRITLLLPLTGDMTGDRHG